MSSKPLPPISGFNVVYNAGTGLYVYSKYSQNELDQRIPQVQGGVETPQSKGQSYGWDQSQLVRDSAAEKAAMKNSAAAGSQVYGTQQEYGGESQFGSKPNVTEKPSIPVNSSLGEIPAPPIPVIKQPIKEVQYENLSQFNQVHPQNKPLTDLVDLNSEKGSNSIYKYVQKNYTNAPTLEQFQSIQRLALSLAMQPKPSTPKENGITSTSTEYIRKEDNPIKAGLASLVEIPAFIGFSFAGLAANITGKEVLGIKPAPFGNIPILEILGLQQKPVITLEQEVTGVIQKNIGITPLDRIMSGDLNPKDFTLGETIAGLAGSALGLYFTGGGNIKSDIGSLVSRTTNAPSRIASIISKATQEDQLVSSGAVKITNEHFEFSQGTIATSGVKSVKYSELSGLAPQVERTPIGTKEVSLDLGNGKTVKVSEQTFGTEVKATKPMPPSYIKETTEIPAIGPKGEKTTISIHTEIKLNPEAEGQAKIPYTAINTKGSTAFVRGEGIQDILPVNEIAVTFEGASKLESSGLAVHLNLEEAQGLKNTFVGKATPHVLKHLEEAEKAKLIKPTGEIFEFPTEQVVKGKGLYQAIVRNPEIIKGNKLPEAIRPNIIRTFSGIKPDVFIKPKAERLFKTKGTPEKKESPLSSFDEERYPLMTSHLENPFKSFGHPETILKEASELKSFENVRSTPHEIYAKLLSRNIQYETIFERVPYPPTKKESTLSLITTEQVKQSDQIRSSITSKQLETNVQDVLNLHEQQNKSIIDLMTKSETITAQRHTTIELQLTGQKTETILTPFQTTEQIQIHTPDLIPKIPNEKPPRITVDLPIFEEKKLYPKKPKKVKAKDVNFLGNANINSVIGLYNRSDLLIGLKNTARQLSKDIRHTSESKFEKNPIVRTRKELKENKYFTSVSQGKKKGSISSRSVSKNILTQKRKKPKF